MKTNAQNIELFKNLSEYDLGGEYFDFHNEFNCIKITFENNLLTLFFEKIEDRLLILMKFDNVVLEKVEFDHFSEMQNLTIDTLYRGRFEKEGKLFEFSNTGKSYFYLEFYKGGKMEFWCDDILVD